MNWRETTIVMLQAIFAMLIGAFVTFSVCNRYYTAEINRVLDGAKEQLIDVQEHAFNVGVNSAGSAILRHGSVPDPYELRELARREWKGTAATPSPTPTPKKKNTLG